MKKQEYWQIMDEIDTMIEEEWKRCNRHCELNKDCAKEVIHRRSLASTHVGALSELRHRLANMYKPILED